MNRRPEAAPGTHDRVHKCRECATWQLTSREVTIRDSPRSADLEREYRMLSLSFS